MNKAQADVLRNNGFAFEGIPNLHPQPRLTYYSRNKDNGLIVTHNLPADPYSLNHYLGKGFVLNQSDLKPQAVEQSQEGDFVCEVCGKSFTKRIALLGHSRSHKVTVGGN